MAAFRAAEADLPDRLLACSSGKELAAKGYEQDVLLAADLNVSVTVPVLRDGAYRAAPATQQP